MKKSRTAGPSRVVESSTVRSLPLVEVSMARRPSTKPRGRSSARPRSSSGARSTGSAISWTTCRRSSGRGCRRIVRRAYQATDVKTATRLLNSGRDITHRGYNIRENDRFHHLTPSGQCCRRGVRAPVSREAPTVSRHP